MDQGDYIRHRARPEWGIGQVLRRLDDRIDVQFSHGLVPLKLSVAAAFIERVSRAEAAAARAAAPSPDATAQPTARRPARKRKDGA